MYRLGSFSFFATKRIAFTNGHNIKFGFGTTSLRFDVLESQKLDVDSSSNITATDDKTSDSKILRQQTVVYPVQNTRPITTSADWGSDDELVQYIVDEFEREHGIDLGQNTEVMSRVRDAAEEAICDLFNHPLNDETEVNLPYIIYDSDEPKHLRVKIYRSSIELRPVNYDALKSLSYSRYHLSKYNAQLAGKDLWTCLSLAVRELYGKINIGIENRHATEALFYFAVDLHPRERIPLNWAFVKAYL